MLKIAAAVGSVVLVTFVLQMTASVSAIVNATTVGFTYLIVILLVAAWWGIAEALVASIVATVSFNYFFLPPVGTWAIEDPENWVALFSFLATSFIASELSNRAKRRAIEANARKVEMERLYALSRAILAVDGTRPIGEQIAIELDRIFEISAVAIYDRASDSVHRVGAELLSGMDTRLREIARSGSQAKKDEELGMILAPIRLGG